MLALTQDRPEKVACAMLVSRTRSVVALVISVVLLTACGVETSGTVPPPADPTSTLVLYDTTGTYGYLGELYALLTRFV